MITLDSGENYEFHRCEMKKRREAWVGFLIQIDPNTLVSKADVPDPRIIASNLNIHGFNIRLVNVYSPAESDSGNKKDSFYRLLNKTYQKQEKYEKVIVVDDFNASITDITGVYRNTATAEVMLFLMMIAAVMLPTPKHFLWTTDCT